MEKYRPDIDGLRAVAVISVVLYHAGVKALSGGYVGVDVFLVISGYLITRYVDEKIGEGKFRIIGFYERRVRRILPALLFLLMATSALGAWVLLPNQLYSYAQSVVAAILFGPNILFYKEAGYFDLAAKFKPLLHLWSLGVEEQFYIFFPPAMMLAARLGRRGTLFTVYTFALGSFAASVWGVGHNPNAAFYLVPFRAWELLVGSILALGAIPKLHSKHIRELLSTLGLLMILASCFLFSPDTAFPGAAAALPCIGSGLMLYSNEAGNTVVGKALSVRPMVAIGLISYSLYLWHWPLLVFTEQFLGRPLTASETARVVAASVAAAALSWKFVEQPFRRRVLGASRSALFAEVAAIAFVVTVAASVVVLGRGLPQRFSPQVSQLAAAKTDRDMELASCDASLERIQNETLCRLGASRAGKPDFVLWGDSHAAAIAPAFKVLAKETGVVGWLAGHLGCAPLLGVARLDRDTYGCPEFNDAVIDTIERNDIRVVVLAGRWDINALGRTSWELSEGMRQVFIRDAESKTTSLPENRAVFARGLLRTLMRLKQSGRTVLLLMDVPNTAVDTPTYLARSARHGFVGQDATANIAHSEAEEAVDQVLRHAGQEFQATIVNLKSFLCSGSNCLIAKDGRSLYRDDHHLTAFGASQLIEPLRADFQRFLLPPAGS